MAYVHVPRYARYLRMDDLLRHCPEGCQCTGSGHTIAHLQIDHIDHTAPRDGLSSPPGRVVVGYCTSFPAAHFGLWDVVTVLVEAMHITPLRAHAARIRSSELVEQGWYRRHEQHEVGCSCGWAHPEPFRGGTGSARHLWETHRAEAISADLAPQYARELDSSRAVLVAVPPIPRSPYAWRVVYRATGTSTPPAPAAR